LGKLFVCYQSNLLKKFDDHFRHSSVFLSLQLAKCFFLFWGLDAPLLSGDNSCTSDGGIDVLELPADFCLLIAMAACFFSAFFRDSDKGRLFFSSVLVAGTHIADLIEGWRAISFKILECRRLDPL
jgi:hypothetical protein